MTANTTVTRPGRSGLEIRAALVDELEELGYARRRPDPTDRRAKLIVLTTRGRAAIDAGITTIRGIEDRIERKLGRRGHATLRRLLTRLLDED